QRAGLGCRGSPGPPSFPAARLPAGSLGGFCAMRMLVLGAGLQGSACAYDLLQQPGVERVTIADLKRDRLPAFLEPYVGTRLTLAQLDVQDGAALRDAIAGHDAVLNAAPYYFNLEVSRAAVAARAYAVYIGGDAE